MDEINTNRTLNGDAVDGALRRELLISQIVDGVGDGTAWAEFSRLAAGDAAAWKELAMAQRHSAALNVAVEVEIARADAVELPATGAHAGGRGGDVAVRALRWGGWAVAAAVALSWVGIRYSASADRNSPVEAGIAPANMFRLNDTQDAISAYKQIGRQSGTVLGEVPDRVIVESRPLGNGKGFEVVFLRQFMERAQVPQLYQMTRGEGGEPGKVMLPVAQPVTKRSNRID